MKEDGHTIFDPALGKLNLRLQLGVRADSAHEIAATILASVSVLERLDPRPMEWITVTRAAPATAGGDFLPRNIDEATSLVESGARKDDAGKFYEGSGYFVQLVSFLNATDRSVSPFHASIADGASDAPSHNSLKLTFKQAMIPSRETFVACLVELFDLWLPERGGLFSSAITRKNRDQPIWYPPVGVVTYFANDSGHVLPEDPLVDLHPLRRGTLAVLKNWTLDATQKYEAAFRAVNNAIPNERSAVRNHMRNTDSNNLANQHNGLLQEQEAFDRLGVLLHGLLGPGDERIELTASVTTSTNEQHFYIFNPNGRFSSQNGPFNDHGGTSEVSRAIKDLREASYRVGSGTWFGVHFVVTASGNATANYNFDHEPEWDFPVAPAVYVRDQLKYPRDEHKQPAWLKQKLREGSSN